MSTLTAIWRQSTALASSTLRREDAVWVGGNDPDPWLLFLDDSLAMWEVYVDGIGRRTFTHPDTWEILDGKASLAFTGDYIDAYLDTGRSELRTIDTLDPRYAVPARAFAKQAGTDQVRTNDRLVELASKAEALVVAAAGIDRASSALQRQVFAVRHVGLSQDLAVLEQEVERVRSALLLASCALPGAPE